MEQIVADAGAWSVQRVQALRPSLEQWLRGRNCAPTEASSAATHVIELLSTTLSSEDGRWVLARHEDDAAELALSTASSGTDDNATAPITRVVDRSFIAKGARWIIDYKTADVGRNIDLDQLRAHAERYRPQLEQYARLFQAEAQTIRMAIYYLAHGKLIELS